MSGRQTHSMMRNAFMQGICYSVGLLFSLGAESEAENIMNEAGYTLADFEKAECDEFDIQPIRDYYRSMNYEQ